MTEKELENTKRDLIYNLSYQRKMLNYSQTEIAEELHTTQQVISSIEKGKRTPNLEVLIKYADVLGLKVILVTK